MSESDLIFFFAFNRILQDRLLNKLPITYLHEENVKLFLTLLKNANEKQLRSLTLAEIILLLKQTEKRELQEILKALERASEKELLRERYLVDTDDLSLITREIEKFLRARGSKKILIYLAKAIEEEDIEKQQMLQDKLSEVNSFKFEEEKIERFRNRSITEYYGESIKEIQSRSLIHDHPFIKKILPHGFPANSLSIIVAPPHTGKCITGDSKITVRNKRTGEVKKISIREFFEMCKRSSYKKSNSYS